MIVYISGKITGNENYKADFENAEKWLVENGYTPINPARLEIPNLTYQQYMVLDYELIKFSDGIFMLGGWQGSKGACAELSYAKSLGKKVIYQAYYERGKDNEIRTIQSDN